MAKVKIERAKTYSGGPTMVRVNADTRKQLEKLADIISKNSGFPVTMTNAVAVAVAEAIESRTKKGGG